MSERCRCIHIQHAANGGDRRCKNVTEQHQFCGPCQSEGAVDCRIGEWRLAPYEVPSEDTTYLASWSIDGLSFWWMPAQQYGTS